MDAAYSNYASAWPNLPCACGCVMCIPTKAGRYYFKCPRKPPCKRWIGWCDEQPNNVTHSGDNRSHQLTEPFHGLQVDLHSLTEHM